MNNIILETQNYKLVVGRSVTDKSTDSVTLCYQIVNKKYLVIEVETFMLPQALKYIDDLEAGLQALEDMKWEKEDV